MHCHIRQLIRALLLCSSTVCAVERGDIVFSEIMAAPSERLLYWSEQDVPRVGTGPCWYSPGYEDEGWLSGQAPLGSPTIDTVRTVLDLANVYTSVYLRSDFEVTSLDANRWDSLILDIFYADGFVAYLNGHEVARRNLGPSLGFVYHDQTAFQTHPPDTLESISLVPAVDLLHTGTNHLAVQVHSYALWDETIYFDAGLRFGGRLNKVLKPQQEQWRYFLGMGEPSGGLMSGDLYVPTSQQINPMWTTLAFDDSTWSEGPGGLGYGDGDDATEIVMQNLATSLYVRTVFDVRDVDLQSEPLLQLKVDYDDGFVAYLNGREIARRNIATNLDFVPYNEVASSGREAGEFEMIALGQATEFLVPGENCLAIQVHNTSLTSSDLTLIADLEYDVARRSPLVHHSRMWRYFIGTEEPTPLPTSGQPDPDTLEEQGKFVDWLELKNQTDTDIDLTGFALSDQAGQRDRWVFPEITLPAQGYLVVLATGNDSPDANAPLQANFKLKGKGETITLYDNSTARVKITELTYPRQLPFYSYARIEDTQTYYYTEVATPGRANDLDSCYQGIVQKPEFSRSGGFYDGQMLVALSCETSNAVISYTTDGTDPTVAQNGHTYDQPLQVDQTMALRVRCFKEGYIPSDIKTETYLLNQPEAIKTLPALCLTADPGRALYDPYGILAFSPHGVSAEQADYAYQRYRGRAFERPVTLELLLPTGKKAFHEDCGIRVAMGDQARRTKWPPQPEGLWVNPPGENDKQKYGLRFYFRKDYGSEYLHYQMTPDSALRQHKILQIRSGAWEDATNPDVTDTLLKQLHQDCGHISPVGRFMNLFINGEFKACYHAIEYIDEAYFQAHARSDQMWDVLKRRSHKHPPPVQTIWIIRSGDDVTFFDLHTLLLSQDMTTYAGFQAVEALIDLNEYIDYLLISDYGVTVDWPWKNWIYARERVPGGKFGLYLWDCGCALGKFSEGPVDYKLLRKKCLSDDYVPMIFNRMRHNPEFRLRFADRIQKHLFNGGALTDAHILKRYQELKAEVQAMREYVYGRFNNRIEIQWIPQRKAHMFAEFKEFGLWPDVVAPTVDVPAGPVVPGARIQLTHTNTGGILYFNTQGLDPRLPGSGKVAEHAKIYDQSLLIEQRTHLKARVLLQNQWSPLLELTWILADPSGPP